MKTKKYLEKTKNVKKLFDVLIHKIFSVKILATEETYLRNLKTDDNTRGRILDFIQNEELKMSHESTIAEWNKATNLTKSNIQAKIKVSVIL